jgi:hypothetical protein
MNQNSSIILQKFCDIRDKVWREIAELIAILLDTLQVVGIESEF